MHSDYDLDQLGEGVRQTWLRWASATPRHLL